MDNDLPHRCANDTDEEDEKYAGKRPHSESEDKHILDLNKRPRRAEEEEDALATARERKGKNVVIDEENLELDFREEIRYDSWEMLKFKWEENQTNTDTEIMQMCLQFCYLFPKNYEFCKDNIIQLWVAREFFLVPAMEMGGLMEEIGRVYFEEFEKARVFLFSSLHSSTQLPMYKLNHSIFHLLQKEREADYYTIGDDKSCLSEDTLHSSLGDSSIDPISLKELHQAKKLSTLLVVHEAGAHLHRIPRDLFLKLPLLSILDLSHTSIIELPSSIVKLKDLRYLNLSGTAVTTLPNSLCSLYQMQTLKLKGCLKLTSLPKDLRKLKRLRHLDVDLASLVGSKGLGDLTELQSLPAFIVGKHDGCRISELKHMGNLRGTLRILRLENVSSSEEAKEASLVQKNYIQKLELQWTKLQDRPDLLDNLEPHRDLKELQIVGYGGDKLPNWMGDPLFSKLISITIHDCSKCELLPPFGDLPFLHNLYMSAMHEVKVIDHRFFGRSMDMARRSAPKNSDTISMSKAFPRLEKLTLIGMPKLEKWSGMEAGDCPHLQKLNISDCCMIISLPEFPLFISLKQLEISHCPLVDSFPIEGLPTSLQHLVIIDCPLLKDWCNKEEKQNWGMLAHIPHVLIDFEEISRISSNQMTDMVGDDHYLAPVQAQINAEQMPIECVPRKKMVTSSSTEAEFPFSDVEESSIFSVLTDVSGTSSIAQRKYSKHAVEIIAEELANSYLSSDESGGSSSLSSTSRAMNSISYPNFKDYQMNDDSDEMFLVSDITPSISKDSGKGMHLICGQSEGTESKSPLGPWKMDARDGKTSLILARKAETPSSLLNIMKYYTERPTSIESQTKRLPFSERRQIKKKKNKSGGSSSPSSTSRAMNSISYPNFKDYQMNDDSDEMFLVSNITPSSFVPWKMDARDGKTSLILARKAETPFPSLLNIMKYYTERPTSIESQTKRLPFSERRQIKKKKNKSGGSSSPSSTSRAMNSISYPNFKDYQMNDDSDEMFLVSDITPLISKDSGKGMHLICGQSEGTESKSSFVPWKMDARDGKTSLILSRKAETPSPSLLNIMKYYTERPTSIESQTKRLPFSEQRQIKKKKNKRTIQEK